MLKYALHRSAFYRTYYADHGIDVDDQNYPVERYIDDLKDANPEVITGYPSGIGMLAELQGAGKLALNPRVVVTGGEPITPGTEELIRGIWNCDLINYDAASESLVKRHQS